MVYPFSRLALFVVAICGWAATFLGGWIALSGVWVDAWDAAQIGTGAGIALGGLLVTVLTIGAQAQIVTARETTALRALMERGLPRSTAPIGPMPGPPVVRPIPPPETGAAPGIRAEPKLSRKADRDPRSA